MLRQNRAAVGTCCMRVQPRRATWKMKTVRAIERKHLLAALDFQQTDRTRVRVVARDRASLFNRIDGEPGVAFAKRFVDVIVRDDHACLFNTQNSHHVFHERLSIVSGHITSVEETPK